MKTIRCSRLPLSEYDIEHPHRNYDDEEITMDIQHEVDESDRWQDYVEEVPDDL